MLEGVMHELPALRDFLKPFSKKEQRETLRELLLIGLGVVKSSISVSKQKENSAPQQPPDTHSYLLAEVQRIASNVEQLNRIVSYSRQGRSDTFKQVADQHSRYYEPMNQSPQKQSPRRHSPPKQSVSTEKKKVHLEENRGPLLHYLPHLNDANVREVMRCPVSPPERRRDRSKELLRPHMHQEEVNKEELERLKAKSTVEHSRRNRQERVYGRTSQLGNAFKKTKSKIKQLVERDRLRHHDKVEQKRFQDGFQKYEYSDNEMAQDAEEEPVNKKPVKVIHSGKAEQKEKPERKVVVSNKPHYDSNTYDQQYNENRPSGKNSRAGDSKRSKRSKEEPFVPECSPDPSSQGSPEFSRFDQNLIGGDIAQGRDIVQGGSEVSDEVSESSSFSQFSMNGSGRRAGRISRRKD